MIDRIEDIFDQEEEIHAKSEIENSPDWMETRLCIHIFKDSYREKSGTGHAICDDKKCEVHYDNANPHEDFLGHILKDSPYRIKRTVAYPIYLVGQKNIKEKVKLLRDSITERSFLSKEK